MAARVCVEWPRSRAPAGAGSGIGRAVALRLAAEGAAMVGCDVDTDGLDGTGKLLAAAGHAAVITSDGGWTS
ncbi:hypothetical protein O7543_08140 [Solwaraspora sp. WMMA2080]|uniref:hypothetical protein n=1 Tax=unclassified Solwaraspora TaxID=2627926 RepID=UPI00248C2814|nr:MULTISPECIES: hypothetical protein [unclassified Solwaraspora]WBB99047.1 hypothetical protein O7553_09225 [Solwaraspora sp. WMMA2059]WBC22400.1 hypothetical protein O7543_08140 [Solwaraspora sp. WMMA2080]